MMAHKHLHELLEEDQEPFLLKNYIADRKSQIKKTVIAKSPLQPKKRKPVIYSSISKHNNLYKEACFFSFQNSPDVRKSPCKSPNAVVLHIPARTAALLLESAMRIQKQKSSASKPKTQITNVGFGLFGSIIKKLSSKSRTRDCEVGGGEASVLERKSRGKGEKPTENVAAVEDENAVEMGFSCSCSYSRRNSTIWSESNEEKSLDLESSSGSRSDEFEEIEERENGAFDFCEKRFCSSPLSPFRFAFHNNSPSPCCRTPVFSSPAASPSRLRKQEEENCEVGSRENIHLVEKEEEKEQFSPVSVLDPPFEDDEDGNGDGDDEGSYDQECSYAIVQRAKQQLLHKLRRFEKLAELDPIELEKRMLEEQDNGYESEYQEEEEEFEEAESISSDGEDIVDGYVREVLSQLGFQFSKVPPQMKRLILDLIAEEKREEDGTDKRESVVKRVCKRLDSWKVGQSNTIDMMVELDFRREIEGWNIIDKEQVRDAAMEIEVSIFRLLVEELSEELADFSGERS